MDKSKENSILPHMKISLIRLPLLTKGCKMDNETTNENVLSVGQRRQRGMQLRRRQSRIKRQRKLQSRRFADKGRIKKRSQRGARTFFKKRVAGGKSYSKLSTAQKMTVDRRVSKMGKAISKVASRLAPSVRRREQQRRRTSEDFMTSKGTLINESSVDYSTNSLSLEYALEDITDILDMLDESEGDIEDWVSDKIAAAVNEIQVVRDYLEMCRDEDEDDYDSSDEDYDEDEYYESFPDVVESILEVGIGSFSQEEQHSVSYVFEEHETLQKKADKSGITLGIIHEVYVRGLESYVTVVTEQHVTMQQHAYTRLNAFISNGSTDADLQEAVKMYQDRTNPGQDTTVTSGKYEVDSVMTTLNDVNSQRVKKVFEDNVEGKTKKMMRVLYKEDYNKAVALMTKHVNTSGESLERIAENVSGEFVKVDPTELINLYNKSNKG
jgi:hypothetical protein